MSGQGDNIPPEVINEISDNVVQNMRQDVGRVDFKDWQQALSNDQTTNVKLPDLALGNASNAISTDLSKEDLATRSRLEKQRMPDMHEAWENHNQEFAKAMSTGDVKGAMASLDSISQATARHIAALENQVGAVDAARIQAEIEQRNQQLAQQIV